MSNFLCICGGAEKVAAEVQGLRSELFDLQTKHEQQQKELAHATMAAEAEADYADRLKAKLDAAEKDIVRQERIIELYKRRTK